jgi:hypothetical protein
MRRSPVLATIAAAFLAGAAAATSARPSLTFAPSTVRAGQTVEIRGSADGCPVGDTVFVISHAFARTHEFAGVPAVLVKVRAGGVFRATTRIPRTKKPGLYGATARCGGGNLGVLAHLRVRA